LFPVIEAQEDRLIRSNPPVAGTTLGTSRESRRSLATKHSEENGYASLSDLGDPGHRGDRRRRLLDHARSLNDNGW
jgi:hypothetical protein